MSDTTSTPSRLTFAAFLATAEHVDCLASVSELNDWVEDNGTRGVIFNRSHAPLFLYAPTPTDAFYYVEIGNFGMRAETMEEAAVELYHYYCAEVADESVRYALADTAPKSRRYASEAPETTDDLGDLYLQWLALHGLKLGCAAEALMDRDLPLTDAQRDWLNLFCARWDAAVSRENGPEAPLPVYPHPATLDTRLAFLGVVRHLIEQHDLRFDADDTDTDYDSRVRQQEAARESLEELATEAGRALGLATDEPEQYGPLIDWIVESDPASLDWIGDDSWADMADADEQRSNGTPRIEP